MPLIVPGQRYRSRDPRDEGLVVTVLRVEPTSIRIQRNRKSWVRLDRFLKDYEGPVKK
jgi:hypothetical protein